MISEDWKVLMHALSIQAQAVPFSKGLKQRERDAIADHMIGVADFIHSLPQPRYIEALSQVGDHLREKLKVAELQNDDLRNRLQLVCEAVEEYVAVVGPQQIGPETVEKWRVAMGKAIGEFSLKRVEPTPKADQPKRCCNEPWTPGHSEFSGR